MTATSARPSLEPTPRPGRLGGPLLYRDLTAARHLHSEIDLSTSASGAKRIVLREGKHSVAVHADLQRRLWPGIAGTHDIEGRCRNRHIAHARRKKSRNALNGVI